MNALPAISPVALAPAISTAISNMNTSGSRRIMKPTVPAVAGSIRRAAEGTTPRPIALASIQPIASTAIPVPH